MSSDASGSTAETDMVAAFKSPAAQAAFEQRFKLTDSAGVHLTVQAAGADTCSSWFDTAAFFRSLQSASLGHVLLASPSIPSTQEFMRAHTHVLPQGAVLVADVQTRGKGRGGNVWTSPPGCLMFSAFRQLRVSGQQAPFINYVVCLAIERGIRDATQHLVPGGVRVSIKWPNDIYHGGLKIGGALIHTTWGAAAQQFSVLTGVGLNVSNAAPTTCLDAIVAAARTADGGQQQQQQEPPPPRVCKEQLLAAVLARLEQAYDAFEASGFGPLEADYLAAWMHSNQEVELLDEGGAAGGQQQRVKLTIVGLSPAGFLLARDAGGGEWELTPDGNSLDMLQGLIRKKL